MAVTTVHLPKLTLCPHDTPPPPPQPRAPPSTACPCEPEPSRSSCQWDHSVCPLGLAGVISTVSSGAVHAVAGDRMSFLRRSDVHCVAGPHLSVTHPSVGTGLPPPPGDCTALLWTWGAGILETPLPVLLGADPEVASPAHVVVLCLIMGGPPHCSHGSCTVSPPSVHRVPLLHALGATCFWCFGFSHPRGGVVASLSPLSHPPRAWGGERLVTGSLAVCASVRLQRICLFFELGLF